MALVVMQRTVCGNIASLDRLGKDLDAQAVT
jgi:hypothetical protein